VKETLEKQFELVKMRTSQNGAPAWKPCCSVHIP